MLIEAFFVPLGNWYFISVFTEKDWGQSEPDSHWKTVLHQWDVYHIIRTICALLCFLLFIAAAKLDTVKA
jgi:hypothetical protein